MYEVFLKNSMNPSLLLLRSPTIAAEIVEKIKFANNQKNEQNLVSKYKALEIFSPSLYMPLFEITPTQTTVFGRGKRGDAMIVAVVFMIVPKSHRNVSKFLTDPFWPRFGMQDDRNDLLLFTFFLYFDFCL